MAIRLTVWYNRHEPQDSEIRRLVTKTGLPARYLPTSGAYTVWARGKDDSIETSRHGPTDVAAFLTSLIE
jgi:hypothetical protein